MGDRLGRPQGAVSFFVSGMTWPNAPHNRRNTVITQGASGSLICYEALSPQLKQAALPQWGALAGQAGEEPLSFPGFELHLRVTLHFWIPFGDHPLKLERYRED